MNKQTKQLNKQIITYKGFLTKMKISNRLGGYSQHVNYKEHSILLTKEHTTSHVTGMSMYSCFMMISLLYRRSITYIE